MRLTSGIARAGLLLIGGVPAIISFLAGDVLLGIILLLIGEVTAAVAALAAGVFKELGNRWRDRIIETMDQYILIWVSRFGKEYSVYVLDTLRRIEQQGPTTTSFYRPELDEIFVDIGLAHKAPHQVSGSLLADSNVDDYVTSASRNSIDDFIDKPDAAVLAILGAPGSGKTTLLRRTAREIARKGRNRKRRIPILLTLRDHADLIEQNPEVDVSRLLRRVLTSHKLDPPTNWFERRLRAGTCVVLLDGLDEIGRAGNRKLVSRWIELQTKRHHRNDFIVTSRPYGYLTAPIDEATVLTVRNFSDTQVATFIRRWYWAVEHHGEKPEGSYEARVRAESGAKDLLDRLTSAPALYDLTANPLLLTMLVNVHRHRGALPGSRVDLYNEICEVMLWRRQEAKKIDVQLDGSKKKLLLSKIAFTMMEREARDLSTTDMLFLVREGLRRVSREMTPESFLDDVGSNGLVVERENGILSFAHLTFQEYLAAYYVKEKKTARILAEKVDTPWWRETTLLYAAKSDADEIVQACLDAKTVTALSLAIDCVDQGSELEPELRDQIEDMLKSVFESHVDPDRRRLMAGVLVNRHLRNVVRTRAGMRVCANPITAGLYNLFRQDTHHPAPDIYSAAESDPDDSVVGVRGADAKAFVSWVNNVSGSQTPYQLVELEQVFDPVVQAELRKYRVPLSIWTKEDSDSEEISLWTSQLHTHPHLVTGTTVADHVTADIRNLTPSLMRLMLLQALMESRLLARDLDNNFAWVRASAANEKKKVNIDLALSQIRKNVTERTLNYFNALEKARPAIEALGLQDAHDIIADVLKAVAISPAKIRSSALKNASDITDELIASLDPDLARCFAVSGDLSDHVTPDLVMGQALANVFAQTRNYSTTASTWSSKLAAFFVEQTLGSQERLFVVAPDDCTVRVKAAKSAVLASYEDVPDDDDEDSDRPSLWARNASIALEQRSRPMFRRERELTPQLASAIRLSALCLASERIPLKSGITGELFREIAASVTLLEQRKNGEAVPTETILLAPA